MRREGRGVRVRGGRGRSHKRDKPSREASWARWAEVEATRRKTRGFVGAAASKEGKTPRGFAGVVGGGRSHSPSRVSSSTPATVRARLTLSQVQASGPWPELLFVAMTTSMTESGAESGKNTERLDGRCCSKLPQNRERRERQQQPRCSLDCLFFLLISQKSPHSRKPEPKKKNQ